MAVSPQMRRHLRDMEERSARALPERAASAQASADAAAALTGCCSACVFGGGRYPKGAIDRLRCRRRPPTAAVMGTAGEELVLATLWPEVMHDDWCGEFREVPA